MAQDTIIKNKDNPVIINFSGVDLTLFNDIHVHFGADQRTLLLNPESIIVNSATELELNFQDTTETSGNYWCVTGFDGASTNGTEITSKNLGNLPVTPILDGC